ncbi:MAG TPA: dTDP-4-dehydrorhamnose 3,5-epimerase [Bdellovibrionota bacterium]|nr:dTDP-4-dehydrorhamnose 3,5-epimerase [Bdellovibrionota bacterium]
MKVTRPQIPDLILIELPVYGDDRGFFVERFNQKKFQDLGLPTKFVQDNHSLSKPSVLRGLHYQTQPSQGKLVGCSRGRIWDIAVDLRPQSPTFGRHYAAELSAENGRLLWIPTGFAHGFCVLGDEPADVIYKVDAFYNAKSEGGIRWDDPDLQIPWPIKRPLVSPRDEQLPTFADYRRMPPIWS